MAYLDTTLRSLFPVESEGPPLGLPETLSCVSLSDFLCHTTITAFDSACMVDPLINLLNVARFMTPQSEEQTYYNKLGLSVTLSEGLKFVLLREGSSIFKPSPLRKSKRRGKVPTAEEDDDEEYQGSALYTFNQVKKGVRTIPEASLVHMGYNYSYTQFICVPYAVISP